MTETQIRRLLELEKQQKEIETAVRLLREKLESDHTDVPVHLSGEARFL